MSQEAFFRLLRVPRRLLLVTGLFAFSLMFAGVDEARAWAPKCSQLSAFPGSCCWSGTAPVCTAGCPKDYVSNPLNDSKDGDGALSWCVIGTHKLCCPFFLPASLEAPADFLRNLYVEERGEGSPAMQQAGEKPARS